MKKKYQCCVNCLMDTSDPKITFDSKGICKHCYSYKVANAFNKKEYLSYKKTLESIRKNNKKYNCIVGISGGFDSTFLLLHAVKDLKLRPLAVHVDNGWNTGIANINIHNLCKRLNVELYTKVLDWKEFRKMQIAILEAGVPDLEAPTDLFINYSLREIAYKFNIRYILSGNNPQTEHIMGSNWSYGQRDPLYLKGLYKRYWGVNPKLLPFKNWYKTLFLQFTKSTFVFRPLIYYKFKKNEVLKRIVEEAEWTSYPRKHGESFITRFYQDYFLPKRFGFDKQRAHLSNNILNKDITRKEGLKILNNKSKINNINFEADKKYLCAKLEISSEKFNQYMNSEKYFHTDYYSIKNTFLFRVFNRLNKSRILGKNLAKKIKSTYHF